MSTYDGLVLKATSISRRQRRSPQMRSVIPAKRTSLSVHRQGTLDGLCGVYSIVNGVKLMLGQSFDERRLFSDLIMSLGSKAPKMIVSGMHLCQYMELMRLTKRLLADMEIGVHFRHAFAARPATLQDYWNTLETHQASHGAGSVILGMDGVYNHWTCIERVEAHGLKLADSGTMNFVARDRCTIRRHSSARPHRLLPTQTFLLSRNDLSCDRGRV